MTKYYIFVHLLILIIWGGAFYFRTPKIFVQKRNTEKMAKKNVETVGIEPTTPCN